MTRRRTRKAREDEEWAIPNTPAEVVGRGGENLAAGHADYGGKPPDLSAQAANTGKLCLKLEELRDPGRNC